VSAKRGSRSGSRNHGRTSYFDPAALRRAAPAHALALGAMVVYCTRDRLFITHVEELGVVASSQDEVHQTTVDRWLRDTAAPRDALIAGIVVDLISTTRDALRDEAAGPR
jgi:hypothetical protein